MQAFIAVLKAAQAARRPYMVRVQWGRESFTHRAATLADAQAWAELYPAGSSVWITTRRGKLVTFRETARAKGWRVSIAA